MPTIPEKQIENSILSWLAMNRIFAFKVDTVGIFDQAIGRYRRKNSIHRKVGISDILGIYKGKFLALEVKSAKGSLTSDQSLFLREVKENGGISGCVRSIDDVADLLEIT